MQIRIRESGAVMYENEFRALHPNTSMPQQLSESLLNDFGADVVLEGPQAQPTRYQLGFRDGVIQIDGQWFTQYSVVNLDAEQIAAKDAGQAQSIRLERNRKIAETDWRFRSDMTPSQAWKDYCQALRDVPTQAGFPWDFQWPAIPE